MSTTFYPIELGSDCGVSTTASSAVADLARYNIISRCSMSPF